MFEALTHKLETVFSPLKRKGFLRTKDVEEALVGLRDALLTSDVALEVVDSFLGQVREKAAGEVLLRSVNPAQQVISTVYDTLLKTLSRTEPLNLKTSPSVVLMVGRQGVGKTTTTAKLALHLSREKRVLLASLDVARPAAQEQLHTLAQAHGLISLPIVSEQPPLDIARRALRVAQEEGFEAVLLDTAGRLQTQAPLMEELKALKELCSPQDILLVEDAMTGQDAVRIARGFGEALPLTGLIMTRVDGDSRGGAMLSMTEITGCPIKYVGVGERVEDLEPFDPDRMARRILGMGDILALVEKAKESAGQDDTLEKRLSAGQFNLNDMLQQLRQVRTMGTAGIRALLPKARASAVDDAVMRKQEAVLLSMTAYEREHPEVIRASRKRRISAGSGATVQDVNRLLKQFMTTAKMMKRLGTMDKRERERLLGSITTP